MKRIWKSYHTGNSFCSGTQTIVCRLQVWTEPKILDQEAQRYEKPRPKSKRWLPGGTFVALEKKCFIRTHFQRANLTSDCFLYAVWIDILFIVIFVSFFITQSVKRPLFLSGHVSFSGMPLSLSRASPTISTGQQIRQWVRDRLLRNYSAVCLELFSPLVFIRDESTLVNPESVAVLYLFP